MKKSVEQEESLGFVATSVFLLEELKMKKDFVWRLKLKMKTVLPQTYREYDVKLSLNEEPFELRIADLEKKIEQVNMDAQEEMFGNKKTQIANIRKEIKEVEEELAGKLKDSPVIEFKGVIEELKYKDIDTIITLIIPALSVAEINESKYIFKHYKVELIRE